MSESKYAYVMTTIDISIIYCPPMIFSPYTTSRIVDYILKNKGLSLINTVTLKFVANECHFKIKKTAVHFDV